ncbi:MAG: MOSC domain-containing protein [Sandaracinaceae bacterium]
MADVPHVGRVAWIGVRPARGVAMRALDRVIAVAARGLEGDRYAGSGKRQVTLIQAEHLPAIAAIVGREVVPDVLRRNLVVSGINVRGLTGLSFRIGEAILEGTGPCEPCSKMDDALGHGGFVAMRGMGGITARVLEGGAIAIGDAVSR